MRAPLLRAPLPRASARTALALLVVLLATSGPALAQAFGRVVFVVVDAEGNPVEGVKLTITTPEITTFHEEGVTNKKGRLTVGFVDATKVYDVALEHPDYPSGNVQVKPQPRGTITREITVSGGSVGAAPPPGGSGAGSVVYTPTEKVFNAGVEALRADDYATAEAKFREATTMKDDYVPAWSALAGVLVQLERYDEALVAAQRYDALSADDPRAVRLLYEAYKGLGNESEAKKALDRLADLDQGGDTAAMLYNEALAAARVGDHASAKPLLHQALEVDADLQPALVLLATVHALDEEWSEAAATAERVLAADAENHAMLRVRYDAYTNLGDTAKAEEAFAALSAVDPSAAAAGYLEAGAAAFEAGQMQAAAENLEKVVALLPDHARAHYQLGLSYVNLEQTAKAKQHLERFIALAPEDPEAEAAKSMLDYLD